MTRHEAIEQADKWVRDRFPTVPPIAGVSHLSATDITVVEEVLGRKLSAQERASVIGQWSIFYKCDWDTDALGFPARLGVRVDDKTGRVEPIFNDRIEPPEEDLGL
jgi:hypothetical protein